MWHIAMMVFFLSLNSPDIIFTPFSCALLRNYYFYICRSKSLFQIFRWPRICNENVYPLERTDADNRHPVEF